MKSSRCSGGLSVGVLAFGGAEVRKWRSGAESPTRSLFSVECDLVRGVLSRRQIGGRGCKPRSRSVRGVSQGISACGSMARR